MKSSVFLALFFIACIAITTGADGQNVYRCANSYSEKPCAEGVTVNAQDSRTSTQRSQSKAVIRHDMATANAIEKARIKDEAAQRADATVSSPPSARKTTAKSKTPSEQQQAGSPDGSLTDTKGSKNNAKKKSEPEYFTARAIVPKPALRASSSK